MDNFHIRVVSEGKKYFISAMQIAFSQRERATHYQISREKGLVLFWTKPEGSEKVQPLPYPMTLNVAIEFAWNWLEQVEYEPEPVHDGDNKKGWTVYNEDWGHVDGRWGAFVAIMPTWAMYGK